MKLCQIYTVIIFSIKVGYVDIWTRIGYFRRGVVVGKGVFYLYLAKPLSALCCVKKLNSDM